NCHAGLNVSTGGPSHNRRWKLCALAHGWHPEKSFAVRLSPVWLSNDGARGDSWPRWLLLPEALGRHLGLHLGLHLGRYLRRDLAGYLAGYLARYLARCLAADVKRGCAGGP